MVSIGYMSKLPLGIANIIDPDQTAPKAAV